jgi:hypothetical protein
VRLVIHYLPVTQCLKIVMRLLLFGHAQHTYERLSFVYDSVVYERNIIARLRL